jgi:hypothetical protein
MDGIDTLVFGIDTEHRGHFVYEGIEYDLVKMV